MELAQRPQHSTEQEPFCLEGENPGRLLGGGGLGIGALSKLGRRNLERVPKVWGLLGDGPPRLVLSSPLLSLPPGLLVPVFPHLLLPFCASLSTWAGVVTTGSGS